MQALQKQDSLADVLVCKISESSDSLEQWGDGTEQETQDSGFPGPSVINEGITYKLRVKLMQ